ncbi:MAG: hypothetical protein WBE26_03295 [Phycisphaerae bacterium]
MQRKSFGIGNACTLWVALACCSMTARGQEIRWQPVAASGNVVCLPGSGDCGDTEIMLASGGVMVTLFVEVSDWDVFGGGHPGDMEWFLGAVQGTVDSSAYVGGTPENPGTLAGLDLSPFAYAWDPDLGAFQALKVCGNIDCLTGLPGCIWDPLSDCGFNPGSAACSGELPLCMDRPDFLYHGVDSTNVVSTATDDYTWVTTSVACKEDPRDGSRFYTGTLLLEVPVGARGTYNITFDPSPHFTALHNCLGSQFPALIRTPGQITIEPAITLSLVGPSTVSPGDTFTVDVWMRASPAMYVSGYWLQVPCSDASGQITYVGGSAQFDFANHLADFIYSDCHQDPTCDMFTHVEEGECSDTGPGLLSGPIWAPDVVLVSNGVYLGSFDYHVEDGAGHGPYTIDVMPFTGISCDMENGTMICGVGGRGPYPYVTEELDVEVVAPGGTCSPDADGDGIQDDVDDDASGVANFVDESTTPHTRGSITEVGDQDLCVSDAPDVGATIYGVRAKSLGTTGGGTSPADAEITLTCIVPTFDVKTPDVSEGDCITLTCRVIGGSTEANVLNSCPGAAASSEAGPASVAAPAAPGDITVELFAGGMLVGTVELPEANSLSWDPLALEVTAPGSNTTTLTVVTPSGDQLPLAPGGTVTLPPATIPAVSTWGLIALTLALLAGGKIYFGRRRAIRA